jgi:hypothetical protein
MCFASYLLRTKSNSKFVFYSKVLPSAHFYGISPGRLDTGVLLIDFDMGEDQEPGNQGDNKKGAHARTVRQYTEIRWRLLMLHPQGTPTFIARDVVFGGQKRCLNTLRPMPKLDPENGAYKAYKAAVPNRLEGFPPNENEYYKNEEDILHEPFIHKLQYDAESVFWLLLWWAIHACPEKATSPAHEEINQSVWNILTGEQNE